MKTDWIPQTAFILVVGWLLAQVISCARDTPNFRPDAAREESEIAMIQKGYHRNGWGIWEKDK